MALPNFPNSPTLGQQFTVGNATYECIAVATPTTKAVWKVVNQADKSLRADLGATDSTVPIAGVLAKNLISQVNTLLDKNSKRLVYNGTNTVADTAAIQAILSTMPVDTNLVLNGPILINNTLTISSDNFNIYVNGTIKAAAGSDFEYMLVGAGRTRVYVIGGVFDANRVNRASPKTIRRMGAGFTGSTECGFYRVVAKGAEGHGGIPGVGLVVAGNSLRGSIVNCYLQDCGNPADENMAADGVFTSGTQNLVSGIVGSNCTDTLAVIESSDFSIMENISGYNCACVAAITNATADNKRGNIMSNVTGINWKASNTGGIQIGVPSATNGNLLDTIISNVTLYAETGLGFGVGAAINIRNLGLGKAIGVTIDGVRINGSQNQGILCSGTDIEISDGHVKGTTDSCVQFQAGSTGEVTNMRCTGGSFGVLANVSAEVISKMNTFKSQTVAGIGALGTATVDSVMDINRATTKTAKDAGATINHIGTFSGGLSTGVELSAVPAGANIGGEPVYNRDGTLKGYVTVRAL